MSPSLTDLANKYQSDKGTQWGARHGYTKVYEELLASQKHRRIRLLEIGLRFDPYYESLDRSSSPSLQMWLDFFPEAEIFGVDINDFTAMSGNRVTIHQGDQGDVSFLRDLANELPELDVVIDDGSHASYHQQLTFGHLMPRIRQGGCYFIEDLHWQPDWEADLPAVPKTRDWLASPASRAAFEVNFHCDGRLAVVSKR